MGEDDMVEKQRTRDVSLSNIPFPFSWSTDSPVTFPSVPRKISAASRFGSIATEV